MLVRAFSGALFGLAALVVGCKTEKPPAEAATPPAPPPAAVVTVTATEYALDLPAQIPAGVVTLHLVNNGKELHQAQVIRFEDGKTVADFAASMKNPGPPPAWVKFEGGPNGVAPGASADATTELTPGNYAVLCFIPGPNMVPHVMSGMIRPFEVIAPTGTVATTLPVADDTIKMADFSFTSVKPLTSGAHTILVQNDGPQQHEIVLLQLAPGKTVEDFGKWGETMKGPPPAMPLGGITVIESGASGVFTANLTPGDYGFICFVPDAKDGKAHFAHGMVMQFKVS